MSVQLQIQNSEESKGGHEAEILEKEHNELQNYPILRSKILSNNSLIVWRTFGAMYCLAILIWSIIDNAFDFFLYLTCWSALLCGIYLSLICTLTIEREYGYKFTDFVSSSRLAEFSRTLQQITTSLSLVVVAAYWYFIHNLSAMSVHTHGVSAFIVGLDFIFSANEMKFVSTIWKPFAVVVVYITFTIILGFGFDKQVYDALDWKSEPASTAVNTVICLIMLTIFHGLLAGAKRCMSNKYIIKEEIQSEQSAEQEVMVNEDAENNI